jgi:hypothetical protein
LFQLDSHPRFRSSKKAALWGLRGGLALGSESGSSSWKTGEGIEIAAGGGISTMILAVAAVVTAAVAAIMAVAVAEATAAEAMDRRRGMARHDLRSSHLARR